MQFSNMGYMKGLDTFTIGIIILTIIIVIFVMMITLQKLPLMKLL